MGFSNTINRVSPIRTSSNVVRVSVRKGRNGIGTLCLFVPLAIAEANGISIDDKAFVILGDGQDEGRMRLQVAKGGTFKVCARQPGEGDDGEVGEVKSVEVRVNVSAMPDGFTQLLHKATEVDWESPELGTIDLTLPEWAFGDDEAELVRREQEAEAKRLATQEEVAAVATTDKPARKAKKAAK